jgi:hypothetical protein
MKLNELPALTAKKVIFQGVPIWMHEVGNADITVMALEDRLTIACQLICRSTEYDCRDPEMALFIAKLQDEGLFSQPTGMEVVK